MGGMKKKALAAVCCAAVLAGAAAIAYSYGKYGTVQAELAPHFTIKYNSGVIKFKDTNGNEVIPIVIKGTTYLPLRGVCETAGIYVEWVAESNTILLEKFNEGFEMEIDMIAFDSALNRYMISGTRAQAAEVYETGAIRYDYYEDACVYLPPDKQVQGTDGEFVTMEELYNKSYAAENSDFDMYSVIYYAYTDYISFTINE